MEKKVIYPLSLIGIAVLATGLFFMLEISSSFSLPASIMSSVAREQKEEQPILFDYIEVVDSCGPHYEGVCAVARSMPATTSPVVMQLRTGTVLQVASTTTIAGGHTWYKVVFVEPIRYSERVTSDWYVAGDAVRHFVDTGNKELIENEQIVDTNKRIVIDRSDQKLIAYEGDSIFMQTAVSTGLDLTPTPRGIFKIYKKTPTRYMQGPLPEISDQYYDLPGVPWDLYFTAEGGAIHGAYWHNEFGLQWSHGCVNLPLLDAHALYEWAPLGTQVVVKD